MARHNLQIAVIPRLRERRPRAYCFRGGETRSVLANSSSTSRRLSAMPASNDRCDHAPYSHGEFLSAHPERIRISPSPDDSPVDRQVVAQIGSTSSHHRSRTLGDRQPLAPIRRFDRPSRTFVVQIVPIGPDRTHNGEADQVAPHSTSALIVSNATGSASVCGSTRWTNSPNGPTNASSCNTGQVIDDSGSARRSAVAELRLELDLDRWRIGVGAITDRFVDRLPAVRRLATPTVPFGRNNWLCRKTRSI